MVSPLNVNGFVRGYKIRWKLLKSPFNIFEVEQCDNSYDLKAYSQEETYEVFISARTSKGYGPEKQLMFAIGSPQTGTSLFHLDAPPSLLAWLAIQK